MDATTKLTSLTRDLVLGSWRMISWTYRVVATGEKRDALGQDPRGFIVYTPERVMILVLNNHRKRPLRLPPADDEKIALFDTMFAYSGTYTVEPRSSHPPPRHELERGLERHRAGAVLQDRRKQSDLDLDARQEPARRPRGCPRGDL